MTAETDLLPLPETLIYGQDYYFPDQMRTYARANVAHAIAAKDAEIDALRTRLEDTVRESTNKIEALLAELDIRDSIIATHAADTREYQKRISQAEARADKLAEALRHSRWCLTCAEDGWDSCDDGRKIDALLRDQEEGNGQ